jgi:hypothetical protein
MQGNERVDWGFAHNLCPGGCLRLLPLATIVAVVIIIIKRRHATIVQFDSGPLGKNTGAYSQNDLERAHYNVSSRLIFYRQPFTLSDLTQHNPPVDN